MRSNSPITSRRSGIWIAVAMAILAEIASARAPQTAKTAAQGAILSAAVEPLGEETYRLTFTTTGDAGRIAIYASHSPSRHDSTPLAVAASNPITLSVPGARRVYFHLKPANSPSRVASIRRLPLEGAANFRDLGGYRTEDGRFVRWGMLYRSDHLVALTENDYRYLQQLDIRIVCDLRAPSERAKSPTRWQGPEIMSVPVLSDDELKAAMAAYLRPDEYKKRLAGGRAESSSYDRFVGKYADAYRRIFDHLIGGEVPAVTHCTAGRDRTGVYSAIVLTALGVPWNMVMEDYLLTNKYWLSDVMIEERRRTTQQMFGLPELPEASAVRTLYTLDGSLLERTFETIRREHGSFDTFRRTALDVSDAELAVLRARFLEP